jgi:hypothetical protein
MLALDDGMPMELVELAMDIPDMVLDGESDIDMLPISIDMTISWQIELY